MAPTALLGIDLGAGGVKISAVSPDGRLLGEASHPIETSIPAFGWAEQDPESWWGALTRALPQALAQARIGAEEVLGIGVSGGAHIPVLLDGSDRVIRPAILWSDQRSAAEAKELHERAGAAIIAASLNRVNPTWTLAMTVEAILKQKGTRVSTIGRDATVAAAAQRLHLDRIGALVVTEGPRVIGILSERDIVSGVARQGPLALEKRVEELMTWPIVTCSRSQGIKEVMGLMTRHRIRHLPVVEDEALLGIISIGDVVKHRLEELEMEAGVLHDLMIARG